MGQRRYYTDEHLLQFLGLPVDAHLLAFAEHILQIETVLDILQHDADAERVIHGLVKEIAVELDDVRVVLSFKQLDGLFLDTELILTGYLLYTHSICQESWPRPLSVRSTCLRRGGELCRFLCSSCHFQADLLS